MKLLPCLPCLGALVALTVVPGLAFAAAPPPADPGWPRVFKGQGATLTVYQPQVDYWKDCQHIHFRCTIAEW